MSNYLKSLVQSCRNRPARLSVLVLTGVALAIFGIFASNAWTGPGRSVTADPLKESVIPISPTSTIATTEKLQAQVILLRPYGFEPAVITRREGQFLLVVLNRSGAWEANYLLSTVSNSRLREAKLPRERLDWHQAVSLTPGDYILTETNHPDWTCKITVTK